MTPEELGSRMESAMPDRSCVIVAIGEDADEDAVEDLGLDFWGAVDDAERVFRDAAIHTSSIESMRFAAVCGGEVVGAATLGSMEDDEGRAFTFSVAVADGWRRRGLARQLVAAVMEAAEDEDEAYGGHGWFRVWVVNPYMAYLLESLGFETEGSEWTEYSPHMTRQLHD
jgi:ribosomal protein S18 acetylase RimI-like enzyme